MPRLRILAGPTFHDLTEIRANADEGFTVSTDAFEGQIAIYLKGFADKDGKVVESPYFEQEERTGITWSVQFQGRFLKPISANDVLFGNVFDRSLPLPWGFSAVTSFMQYLDPTLEQDLHSSTPWALSPLITTMPHLQHTHLNELHKVPPFPPLKPVGEDVSELQFTEGNDPEVEGGVNRKAYFYDASHRKTVVFGPEDLITADFCWNYLDFSPEGVSARIPGGFALDLMHYWDGLPVRFVCCERAPKGETVDGMPWGRIFWCVAIEAADKTDLPKSKETAATSEDPLDID
ncbi:hypothetical protein EIP91_012405 [Steccherinum ochraceum]|uniref:Domain of unknown function at the cortex 1 domain-containing protein n=1 Tax=Steccherinum ochraceum TaxID=92696 RepID=A0A4R0RKK1_9APHY|nr:hypothetical protein EIP91_012405 [Steccherinum ochraceum]